MTTENTFIMLKPDCIKRGLVGEVITRIERKGYNLIDAKMANLSMIFLQEHYSHLVDKPFFPLVLKQMMSGPVLGIIVSGENAVLGMRILAGATKFEDAVSGTIRGDFALSTESNLIHCSDAVDTAETEIKRFFSANNV